MRHCAAPDSDDTRAAFEVAQEAAPAAFIERRDVGSEKVADALLVRHHFTDINRRVIRQRIRSNAARRLNHSLYIALRLDANQQVRLLIRAFANTGDKGVAHLFVFAEQLRQRVDHLRRRRCDFREQQRVATFQHGLLAQRIALFAQQMGDLARGELFTSGKFGVEKQRFATRHLKQRAHWQTQIRLLILNGFAHRLLRGKKWDNAAAILFFPSAANRPAYPQRTVSP